MRFGAILIIVFLACTTPAAGPTNPLESLPIDQTRGQAVDEAAAWAYLKSADVDLDGDGATERLTLASDVTLQQTTGRPIWEDGHRWAVFVNDRGAETLLYSGFVPHGFVECAVGVEASDGSREVIIVERSPRHLRVMDIAYLGRGNARLRSDAHYPLEQWLPDSATLR